MSDAASQKTKKKGFLRRKSKSSGASVQPSIDGEEASMSSKKSWRMKLGGKKKTVKVSANNNVKPSASPTAQTEPTSNGVASTGQQAKTQQPAVVEEKKPYMLKVALLLVDAATRRFELLQLEFDSDKALVSDALSQIPIHVTEKVLSSQSYSGVCGADGVEKKRTVALFDFCKGNDVLVAIPSGTSSEECARLAKPILGDEKVVGMLSTSGIDADPWTSAPALPASRSVPKRQNPPARSRAAAAPKAKPKSKMTIYLAVAGVIVLALAFWYRRFGGETTGTFLSVAWPKKGSLDPVFDVCNAVCDSGRGLADRFLAEEE